VPRRIEGVVLSRFNETKDGPDVFEAHGSSRGSLRHRAPDDGAAQGERRGGQRGDVQSQPGTPSSTAEQLVSLDLQPLPRLPGEIRLIRQDIDNRRIEPLFEKGQQFSPHPVARNAHVGVRFVLDVRNLTLGEIRTQLVAPARQQRANDRPVSRMHRAQATRAGAAKQAQQERLGLVVTGVTERDHTGIDTRTGAFEKGVARCAGGMLERAVFAASERGDVFAFHAQRPSERVGQFRAESLVTIRRVAKLMIEVGHADGSQLASRVEVPDDVRERDGVGPARQGDDDARVAAREVVPTDELTNPVEKRAHGVLVPEGGFEPPTPRL
jgi:hypothetical protein